MNDKYWESFYKNFNMRQPSSFALFCLPYLSDVHHLIDLGCGNGRDSYFFAKQGISVTGLDKNFKPKNKGNAKFFKVDLKNFGHFERPVYARFFIHSIDYKEIFYLLSQIRTMMFLEFRDASDIPLLYKHKRTLIYSQEFLRIVIDYGFEILFYQKSKDLAKYKGENPTVCRLIAKKK